MPLITNLKTKHTISKFEKIRLSLKIKIGGRRHKTLNVAKNNDLNVFGLILFRGSEEPSETNV